MFSAREEVKGKNAQQQQQQQKYFTITADC
jgi:hypothetical protein